MDLARRVPALQQGLVAPAASRAHGLPSHVRFVAFCARASLPPDRRAREACATPLQTVRRSSLH